jgi:hypothetical protein
MNIHKVSDGSIPTDFTGGRAGEEGSLRLVLERVKLTRRGGVRKTDLGVYQGYPKIRTPRGVCDGETKGSTLGNLLSGCSGHKGIKNGYRKERGYEGMKELNNCGHI